jgi:hypothetical protein
MLNSFFSLCARVVVFGSFSVLAIHSAQAQVTALDRQLNRIDVAVSADGLSTKGVSGNNYLGDSVTQNASTTVGALVQIRYTKSPLIGFEGTYSYARFTENYVCSTCSSTAGSTFPTSPFGAQTNASEYSLGYVAHLPSLFGFQPFAGGGAGVTAFKPTPLGGQGLPEKARATYYVDIGIEDQLTRFFGVRAQLRDAVYKAPDFGQNYLTINKETFTAEPSIGFYVKF